MKIFMILTFTLLFAVEERALLRFQSEDVRPTSFDDENCNRSLKPYEIKNLLAQGFTVPLGAYHVAKILWLWPLEGGLYEADHPWATGNFQEDKKIWPFNIVYASPRDHSITMPDSLEKEHSDEKIISMVGSYLRKRAAESARGKNTKVPHAINYIHGSVHHNGVYMLFNNVQDGIKHISNPEFMREMKRFAHEEKREVTIVFRDRYHGVTNEILQKDYPEYQFPEDATPYEQRRFLRNAKQIYAAKLNAYFSIRMRLENFWFGNPQGPFHVKALWGDWAPYPLMNVINGSWVRDTDGDLRIQDKEQREAKITRPPITQGEYFVKGYFQKPHWQEDGTLKGLTWADKKGAVLTSKRIEATKMKKDSNFNFISNPAFKKYEN